MTKNLIETVLISNKDYKALLQERDELKKTVENQRLEYEELQCDLSEVENTCGCYQSENAELKQENKELKKQLSSTKCYLCGEGFLTPEGTELYEEKERYRSALEEINRVIKLAHKVEDYLLGQDYTDLVDRIEKEINEVLND